MSDYLTDEEQVDRLKKLWRDYGLTVVTALVIGIGGTVAWDFYKEYESNQAQSAFDLYNSYIEASALGEPAEPFIEELADSFGGSSYYVFTLLQSAKDAVDNDNFEEAQSFLSNAYESAKGTPINDMVALRKAKVEFELKDYESVLQTLPLIETEGYRWQALMLQGDVAFLQDELDKARDAYQAAKDSLPSGIDSEPVDMRLASVPLAP